MNKPDCETFREWIALDLGAELSTREQGDLTDHLGTCAACREERKAAEALDGLLHRSRIEVRKDFRSDVLAALPATGWESRAPRSWVVPLAAMILLAAGATFLLSSGSTTLPPGFSALAAVGEMVQASVLAGVGLLDASWKGMGFLVGRMISSPVGFGAFGLLVLSVNLLVVSMIRKRRSAQSASGSPVRVGRR
jgi:predicted anti-sigma-YlaC factor YlaD